MSASEFRAELEKLMPGYQWTVHRSTFPGFVQATGSQSSGSNRLSTLNVQRRDEEGKVSYEVRSAGYGLKAKWLHTTEGPTLARALRKLQDHYEAVAATYRSHAQALQKGRQTAPHGLEGGNECDSAVDSAEAQAVQA
jgi:hypothetical protein